MVPSAADVRVVGSQYLAVISTPQRENTFSDTNTVQAAPGPGLSKRIDWWGLVDSTPHFWVTALKHTCTHTLYRLYTVLSSISPF